jgi:NADH-quinone oxidoreductase subunit N
VYLLHTSPQKVFLPAASGKLFGEMYVTDTLRITLKNILNISVFIIFLQASSWLLQKGNRDKLAEFYILILSALSGMSYMISSGNFLMLYLGLELATLPVAGLAAFDHFRSRSAEAGIKMILSSAFASGILLFGLSILYGVTGNMDFNAISEVFTDNNLSVLGFILFFCGMAFKISIVPFHLWTADVYEGAPINVTSFLSVVSKGASIFVLIIVLYFVFNAYPNIWQNILYVTAILTMTIGNLFALRQNNLKRFLAFSSIAQAGFILLGMIGNSSLGMASVIYFVFIYLFSNLGAFGVVSVIASVSGKENISDYKGLYLTNPRLSLIMMLSLFSLAGIPPVAGFFGKFFLFTAAAENGYYVLVLIGVLNATLALYYYLLVVKAMFIDKSESPIPRFNSPWSMRLSLIICVIGMIAIGFAGFIFDHFQWLSQ